MPPAIIAAGIGAAGALGGAALSSRSANKAADTQAQAGREALQWEKEKEAQRRQDWEKGMAIWNAGRQALAQRYGLDLGSVLPSSAAGAPPAGAAVPPGVAQRPAPVNIAGVMPGGGGAAPAPVDIGSTFDWRRYNLGQ